MKQDIVTRDGRRSIDVVTLKRRIVANLKARPPREQPLLLSDVIERMAHIHTKASRIRTVDDKSDLCRALSSLEADLRRRGVV